MRSWVTSDTLRATDREVIKFLHIRLYISNATWWPLELIIHWYVIQEKCHTMYRDIYYILNQSITLNHFLSFVQPNTYKTCFSLFSIDWKTLHYQYSCIIYDMSTVWIHSSHSILQLNKELYAMIPFFSFFFAHRLKFIFLMDPYYIQQCHHCTIMKMHKWNYGLRVYESLKKWEFLFWHFDI